jgi:multidrug efflux pump subunit AcrA (membrane-fusion protein)
MLTRYLLPAVAVAAFGFAVTQMSKAQQKPPPASPPVDPGRSPFGKQVAGAGIVEPESENISIGTHLPGVVQAVRVKVGDRVSPGALLFELDDRQLKAERDVRAAMLANAQAQRAKVLEVRRKEEIPPYRAKLAEAQAMFDDKVKLYERVRRPTAVGAVSEEDMILRMNAVEVARAQVAKAQADLALMEAKAWGPDAALADAAVLQAQAQLDQTETELRRLKVTAPVVPGAEGFQVLQVNVRPGEFVATAQGQPLVVLGHVGKLHVRADIDENDIGRFAEGVPGVAWPRGNPDRKYPLRFVRVEPYVIPKKSLTGGNTERVDTRVLQVIYAIEASNAPLYVGQQLDVSLNSEGK